MSENSNSSRLKSGIWNALAGLLLSLTTALLCVVVIGALSFGNGYNQSLSESRILGTCYLGMPLAEFRKETGVFNGRITSEGGLRIADTGWLSLFVPQHKIDANFDANGRLVGVHVETICGADESGWQLPLSRVPPEFN